jgi:chromosomal replication initiator protein
MTEGATNVGGVHEQFARVLETIRGRIQKRQFTTWFQPAKLSSWEDGKLVIGLPNRFYQEWFQSKFADVVRDAAEHVSHGPVSVSFEIGRGAASAEETPAEHPAPPLRDPVLAPTAPATHGRVEGVAGAEGYPAPFPGSGVGDSPLRLNDLYTFDNFIVGPSNSVAHASAKGVAQDPGRAYNPLFIHGAVGLGKTHLLHAICHEFLTRFPRERVCFLSCEEFTNEFVRSLQRNDVDSFRGRFRNVHLLVIDDIHFLKGKERTQEEFFHTFNGLYQSGHQIVLSSDAAPNEIPTLEERLVSRFHWGLVSNLEQPETETRMAIVQRKAELQGIEIPTNAVEFIAANFRNNIRELEGALLASKALSEVMRVPIDLDVVKKAVAPHLGRHSVNLDKITQVVCSHYQVKISDLRSKRRGRSVSEPRQIVMFIARLLTNLSLDEIGDHFGGRDHSTVLYAVRKVQARCESDPSFSAVVDRMVDRLGGRIDRK